MMTWHILTHFNAYLWPWPVQAEASAGNRQLVRSSPEPQAGQLKNRCPRRWNRRCHLSASPPRVLPGSQCRAKQVQPRKQMRRKGLQLMTATGQTGWFWMILVGKRLIVGKRHGWNRVFCFLLGAWEEPASNLLPNWLDHSNSNWT